MWSGEIQEKGDHDTGCPVYGPLDLFRGSQILITLPLFFCWPVITLLFYGLSLSADKIKMTEDVYLSFILVSLIEIPSHLLLPLVIDVWGRKPIFFLTQFLPGICCIVAAFLTPGTAIFAVLTLREHFTYKSKTYIALLEELAHFRTS